MTLYEAGLAYAEASKTIKAVSAPVEVAKPTNALPNETAMVRLRPERGTLPALELRFAAVNDPLMGSGVVAYG